MRRRTPLGVPAVFTSSDVNTLCDERVRVVPGPSPNAPRLEVNRKQRRIIVAQRRAGKR